jgi:hypothetical protein
VADERWIDVPAPRLDRWLAGFAERHGSVTWSATPEEVVVIAADGSGAECRVPLPPLAADAAAPFGGLVAHVCAERTVGVLLVRLGGYAAGIFEGPRLVASKVGSRPVHGRSAAGGWSQKRFARRREGQSRTALDAAASAAASVLLRRAGDLQALVTGGDRGAVTAVLGDARLATLLPLVAANLPDMPDPNRKVLESSYARFMSVRIRVSDAQVEGLSAP